MKKQIKAIFFDVDGTIYWHDIHDVIASTREILQQLHACGYKIAIATSRCRREFDNAPSFLREFPFDGYIFDGGALIIKDDAILYQNAIKEDVIQTLLSYAKHHDLALRYATADGNYFIKEEPADIQDAFFKLYLNVPTVKPYDEDICDNILLYCNETQQKEIIPQLGNVNISNHKTVLEITANGTNKATAIQKLAASWGIDMKEVMCFGDGFNDLEMIEQAGVSVAMGNGEEVLRQYADYVCDPLYQDGVATIIHELGLLKKGSL